MRRAFTDQSSARVLGKPWLAPTLKLKVRTIKQNVQQLAANLHAQLAKLFVSIVCEEAVKAEILKTFI